MTDAVLTGFDLPNLLSAAKAAADPKLKYCADIVAALGTTPIVEVRNGATVVYRSAPGVALAYSNAGIEVPAIPGEPPTVNTASGITASSTLVLRNGSNASISVSVPMAVGGGTGKWSANGNLDGTKTLRTQGLLIAPPASLPSTGNTSGNTGIWTIAEADEAISVSTIGPNEGNIWNMNNGSPGFLDGPAMAFGNEWRDLDAYWNWDKMSSDPYKWYSWFEWWGIILQSTESTSTGKLQIKDIQWQVLHKNENTWVRYQAPTDSIGWGEDYYQVGNGYDANNAPSTVREDNVDGVLISVPLQRAPHFTTSRGRYNTPRMGEIEGVIATCLVRIPPGQPSGFKPLIHIGGDPKPSSSPNTDNMAPGAAYTPFAISRTIRPTTTWRRVTASNIQRPNEFNRRHISIARFKSARPMY